ncbi:MAG: murein hydrolase activator EnvC [Sandaracinaceae bacterium]
MRGRTTLLALAGALSVASAASADPDPATHEASATEPEGYECDAAAGGEVDPEVDAERDASGAAPAEARLTLPAEWRTSRGRDCRRYHGRVMCDGPLRVPAPFGGAEELARRIGLDDEVRVGRIAMSRDPEPAWLGETPPSRGEGLLWPVPDGRLWRGFGPQPEILRRPGGRVRRGRRMRQHRGVDIGAPAGSAIRAVNDGLVLYSFNSMRGYGNAVIVLHADTTVTLYAHSRETYVFAGQRVRRGQVIAAVGHTGLAHGDHLHFEWRRAGRPLNPVRHFVGAPD